MMRCAVNAPDHGRLRPWGFLVIKGAGLDALGQLSARLNWMFTPEKARAYPTPTNEA